MLHRTFPWNPEAGPDEPGGALFVPRLDQGSGRHDNPERYGALYLSRAAPSAVGEHLRILRRHVIDERDLSLEGTSLALAAIDDEGLGSVLDLDDPRVLAARRLRPSGVATQERGVTRPIAEAIFDDGHAGFEWWSTIEGSWINVTLFAERAIDVLTIVGEPEPLTLDHPAVREAAEIIGVLLAA